MEWKPPGIKLSATNVRPGEDFPEVAIFGVEVSQEESTWLESFSTEAEVRAFLRGIQAGASMTGGPYVPIPFEMPRFR